MAGGGCWSSDGPCGCQQSSAKGHGVRPVPARCTAPHPQRPSRCPHGPGDPTRCTSHYAMDTAQRRDVPVRSQQATPGARSQRCRTGVEYPGWSGSSRCAGGSGGAGGWSPELATGSGHILGSQRSDASSASAGARGGEPSPRASDPAALPSVGRVGCSGTAAIPRRLERWIRGSAPHDSGFPGAPRRDADGLDGKTRR